MWSSPDVQCKVQQTCLKICYVKGGLKHSFNSGHFKKRKLKRMPLNFFSIIVWGIWKFKATPEGLEKNFFLESFSTQSCETADLFEATCGSFALLIDFVWWSTLSSLIKNITIFLYKGTENCQTGKDSFSDCFFA